MKHAALVVLLVPVAACSSPPSPPASPSTSAAGASAPPTPGTSVSTRGSRPDARCENPAGAETIEVAQGATGRTPLGIAVTYVGSEHDNYEGGKTDTILNLTFQGIMEDGSLTPSAFTWRPSALAPPSFVSLGGMPICVRIASSSPQKVTLDLFRVPSR